MKMNIHHRGHRGARGISVVLIAVALVLCGSGCMPRLYPRQIITTAEGAFELDVLWLRTGQEGPRPFIKP
jgi:hypothetical protein